MKTKLKVKPVELWGFFFQYIFFSASASSHDALKYNTHKSRQERNSQTNVSWPLTSDPTGPDKPTHVPDIKDQNLSFNVFYRNFLSFTRQTRTTLVLSHAAGVHWRLGCVHTNIISLRTRSRGIFVMQRNVLYCKYVSLLTVKQRFVSCGAFRAVL